MLRELRLLLQLALLQDSLLLLRHLLIPLLLLGDFALTLILYLVLLLLASAALPQ